MPQEYYGNRCVPELNAIAQKVMKTYNVPYADVYSAVMKKCGDGKPYASCPLCDNEPWRNPGAPVSRTRLWWPRTCYERRLRVVSRVLKLFETYGMRAYG